MCSRDLECGRYNGIDLTDDIPSHEFSVYSFNMALVHQRSGALSRWDDGNFLGDRGWEQFYTDCKVFSDQLHNLFARAQVRLTQTLR